jgi:hypothetical protein
MNSNNFDFAVSRAFGESDAQFQERAKTYQSLLFKENSLMKQGYSIGAEIDHTRNVKNAINAYLVEAEQMGVQWGLQQTMYTQIRIVEKRIEELQTIRVKIWTDIKEIRRRLASIG